MALTVNFRVVGVYCLLENLSFPHLSPQSTVREVMRAIKDQNEDFKFHPLDQSPILHSIEYTFRSSSQPPPNSTRAKPGKRHLENYFEDGSPIARVLQYYRSVKGLIEGVPVDLVIPTVGQPSFATTPLNAGFNPPPSFQPLAYNLTWRLVQIQLDDESRAKFLSAKFETLNQRLQKK
jgi:hypothetical protein